MQGCNPLEPLMKTRRRPLLLALALGLSATGLAHALSPPAPPQVPEQVSNVAWATDMTEFSKNDDASPPTARRHRVHRQLVDPHVGIAGRGLSR